MAFLTIGEERLKAPQEILGLWGGFAKRFRLWQGLTLTILFGVQVTLPAQGGQVAVEGDVKAVLLLHFAQFAEWPEEAFIFKESPITIGVLGHDPFGERLDEVLKNESIGGRRVKLERFKRVEEISTCHLLYISSSEKHQLDHILQYLRGRPILTVGDVEGFAARGGAINIRKEQNRLRIRINMRAVEESRVKLSSRLLNLAELVENRQPR
jgi:hypothetical protein